MSKLLSIIKTKGCPNCHMDKHARELEQAIKDWVRGLVGEVTDDGIILEDLGRRLEEEE